MTEVDNSTAENLSIEQILNECTVLCSEDTFKSNYTIAQRRAYNGEVTVEDIPDTVTEPTPEEDAAAADHDESGQDRQQPAADGGDEFQ